MNKIINSLGCLVVIAFIGVVFYVGIRFGDVYLDYNSLKEETSQQARSFQFRSEDTIRRNIMDKAADRGVELRWGNIAIEHPAANSIMIRVSYEVILIFPFDLRFHRDFLIEQGYRVH